MSEFEPSVRSTSAGRLLRALRKGTLELQERLPWGSNHTFFALARHPGLTVPCIYKPTKGERPLWDFPPETLAFREVAAYVVSEALGWGLVPPTVYRQDAPHGPGSVQVFVDTKEDSHYFNFTGDEKECLRRVAVFDLLVNNADRKGGHVIFDRRGDLWLIDHGICFHEDPKLRTVIWDFEGQTFPEDVQADLTRFRDDLQKPESELRRTLSALLSADEIKALTHRAEQLVRRPKYPHPGSGRNYPWPPV